jgi:hypothetical protein
VVRGHGGLVEGYQVVIGIFNPRSGNSFSRSDKKYVDLTLYTSLCLKSVFDNPQNILNVYKFPEVIHASSLKHKSSETDDLIPYCDISGIIMSNRAFEIMEGMSGKVIKCLFMSDIKIFDEYTIESWMSSYALTFVKGSDDIDDSDVMITQPIYYITKKEKICWR